MPMKLRATSGWAYRDGQQEVDDEGQARADHGVAARVEFEGKFESIFSSSSFKRLDPGAFNVGFIGSSCTPLPWRSIPC